MENGLVSTRELIFDKALELIARNNFESVSIRDIASAANVHSSTLYHYYKNKTAILDGLYQYYEENNRPSELPIEEMMRRVQHGTVDEIVKGIAQNSYASMVEPIGTRLALINKVIMTRMYTDEKAADIYLRHRKSSQEYLQRVLEFGIQCRRFQEIDSETFAFLLVALYNNLAVYGYLRSDDTPEMLVEEQQILVWFHKIITSIEQG